MKRIIKLFFLISILKNFKCEAPELLSINFGNLDEVCNRAIVSFNYEVPVCIGVDLQRTHVIPLIQFADDFEDYNENYYPRDNDIFYGDVEKENYMGNFFYETEHRYFDYTTTCCKVVNHKCKQLTRDLQETNGCTYFKAEFQEILEDAKNLKREEEKMLGQEAGFLQTKTSESEGNPIKRKKIKKKLSKKMLYQLEKRKYQWSTNSNKKENIAKFKGKPKRIHKLSYSDDKKNK